MVFCDLQTIRPHPLNDHGEGYNCPHPRPETTKQIRERVGFYKSDWCKHGNGWSVPCLNCGRPAIHSQPAPSPSPHAPRPPSAAEISLRDPIFREGVIRDASRLIGFLRSCILSGEKLLPEDEDMLKGWFDEAKRFAPPPKVEAPRPEQPEAAPTETHCDAQVDADFLTNAPVLCGAPLPCARHTAPVPAAPAWARETCKARHTFGENLGIGPESYCSLPDDGHRRHLTDDGRWWEVTPAAIAPTETVDQSGLPGPHANCEHEHRVCVAKPEAAPQRPTAAPAGPVQPTPLPEGETTCDESRLTLFDLRVLVARLREALRRYIPWRPCDLMCAAFGPKGRGEAATTIPDDSKCNCAKATDWHTLIEPNTDPPSLEKEPRPEEETTCEVCLRPFAKSYSEASPAATSQFCGRKFTGGSISHEAVVALGGICYSLGYARLRAEAAAQTKQIEALTGQLAYCVDLAAHEKQLAEVTREREEARADTLRLRRHYNETFDERNEQIARADKAERERDDWRLAAEAQLAAQAEHSKTLAEALREAAEHLDDAGTALSDEGDFQLGTMFHHYAEEARTAFSGPEEAVAPRDQK